VRYLEPNRLKRMSESGTIIINTLLRPILRFLRPTILRLNPHKNFIRLMKLYFLCRQTKTAEISAKIYFKHYEGP